MNRWMTVVLGAVLVVVAAMGLRNLIIEVACTTAPVPPTPWSVASTTAPVPPTPWNR